MLPRMTRGSIRNFDSCMFVDFNHITNSAGNTMYTFDKNLVYDKNGKPKWRLTKDGVFCLDSDSIVYRFEGQDVINSDGVICYHLYPDDFPDICCALGKVFVCDPEGNIEYVIWDGFISDETGKKLYSVEDTRFTSLEDPSCVFEVQDNQVYDSQWNLVFTFDRNRILDAEGNLTFIICK